MYGKLYLDVSSNRKVETICEGGGGVVCRWLDTGQQFSCDPHDFYVWNRFRHITH